MNNFERLFQQPHQYKSICAAEGDDEVWVFLDEVLQEELGMSPKRVPRERVADLFARIVNRLEQRWAEGAEAYKNPALILSRLVQMRLRE